LNPKKALKKGLSGITEEDFVNAMMSFVKENTSQDSSMLDNEYLKEKYPFYKELMKMSVTAARSKDKTQILHFSGMSAAYRILIQIAEDKS
jgi:hypothetical protein